MLVRKVQVASHFDFDISWREWRAPQTVYDFWQEASEFSFAVTPAIVQYSTEVRFHCSTTFLRLSSCLNITKTMPNSYEKLNFSCFKTVEVAVQC